jgi:cytochrome P450 family 6
MSALIVVLVILFLSIYFWLRNLQNFWKHRGFPSTKFIFPFGSLKGIGTTKSLCFGLDEFYKEFKGKTPALGMFYFIKPIILAIEPELIRHILIQNFDNFQNRPLYYNKEDDPISGHLLALEGELCQNFNGLIYLKTEYPRNGVARKARKVDAHFFNRKNKNDVRTGQ